jgi:hypothetical protein
VNLTIAGSWPVIARDQRVHERAIGPIIGFVDGERLIIGFSRPWSCLHRTRVLAPEAGWPAIIGSFS